MTATQTPGVLLAPPVFSELVTSSSENTHIRIQTTKNTKGYSFETVVAVDGADADVVRGRVQELLIVANTMAREEVARLELLDTDAANLKIVKADDQ